MRKLHNQNQDCLDLLLDTLCNVFGGIILIACLLALLVRTEHSKIPPITGTVAEGQLVERRIEAAQAELAELRKLQAEINQKTGDGAVQKLAGERDDLKATVTRLRAKKVDQSKVQNAQASEKARDPGKDLDELRLQRKSLELSIVNSQTMDEAQKGKVVMLRNRLDELSGQLGGLIEQQTERLRFPKEREKRKISFPVIVKYNEVFPIQDGHGAPATCVERISTGDESFRAVPRINHGMSPSSQKVEIVELMRLVNESSAYLSVYVYPDSFNTFRELKRIMHENGIEYGIEIVSPLRDLTFGPRGSSPPPL